LGHYFLDKEIKIFGRPLKEKSFEGAEIEICKILFTAAYCTNAEAIT
jgi:hypothetical protein